MRDSLYGKLKAYREGPDYPFHMPGHKRNPESGPLAELYGLDITEIDGFDNLHQPEGILREAMERAGALYGSEETYFLINGSTAGILSAVSSVAGRGKKLLIARNCHKAVYHAAFLNRLELEYLYPPLLSEFGIYGGVSALQVKEALLRIGEREKLPPSELSGLIAGVVITSPTYEGILSEVSGIVETAHAYGIPVILDQAHGAHFGFHPDYPKSGVREGADLVIHSLHKTLPAPTQTALLHRNGTLTDGELLGRYLSIYQSSSPSYLLMAGIDSCLDLVVREGRERLERLLSYRSRLWRQAEKLTYLRLYPSVRESRTDWGKGKAGEGEKWRPGDGEPGRLVISVRGSDITGKELYERLRKEYHLQMEMYGWDYVVAICSMMDTEEGFLRLERALSEIDITLAAGEKSHVERLPQAESVLPLFQAYTAAGEDVLLRAGIGRIAADFVNLYPPGIPLLVPGERITPETVEALEEYLSAGYDVKGIRRQGLAERNRIHVTEV